MNGHRLTHVLETLQLSKSTYYSYLKWKPSQLQMRREQLKEKVLSSWLKHPMYGYNRLTIYLNKTYQCGVSRYLVYKLMKELGIQSRMTRKRYAYKQVRKSFHILPNMMKEEPSLVGIYTTDITYIHTKNGWVYLASLYKPLTRKVVSHSVATAMTQEFAASVVDKAYQQGDRPSIIHSDMGSQYTSELFEDTLRKYKIRHSYSRKGTPGDNARIESFHSILKREYVHHKKFKNISEAIAGIDQYIRWYNTERISTVA